MEDNHKSKVKLLKNQKATLENQLFKVFKELDYYRNKCKKLRLLLLKERTVPKKFDPQNLVAPEIPTQSAQILELPQKRENSKESQTPSKRSKCPNEIEDGEISELQKTPEKKSSIPKQIKKNPQIKPEDSPKAKLESVFSSPKSDLITNSRQEASLLRPKAEVIVNNTKHETNLAKHKLEANKTKAKQEPVTVKPKPDSVTIKPQTPQPEVNLPKKTNNRPIAYNQPYVLEPLITPPSQLSTNLSPAPQIPKNIKETFEIVKKLYQSDYEFNINNIYLISEALKSSDSSLAGCYFIQELIDSIFIFSPSDAFNIVCGTCQDLMQNSHWSSGFLKSIRNYFIHNSQDIYFSGKSNKLLTVGILVNTLQEVLHASFVLVCKQNNFYWIIIKMLAKVVALKNFKLIRATFTLIGEEFQSWFALRILHRVVVREENFVEILKEVNELCGNGDEIMKKSIYLVCKSIFRYVGAKDSYEAYRNIFWHNLTKKKNSFFRVLVIRIIAVLYLILEKEGKVEICLELEKKLKEIVEDKDTRSFSQQEKLAVSQALKKTGCN